MASSKVYLVLAVALCSVLYASAAPSPYSFAADEEAHALEEDFSPDMYEQEQVARALDELSDIAEETDVQEEMARGLEDALNDEAAPSDFEEVRQVDSKPVEFESPEEQLAAELVARALVEEAANNLLDEDEDDFFE